MSSWEIPNPKRYPELGENIQADVVIMGGGLAGVWCAYLLAKAGMQVVVLEKDKLGHGETYYTTAFITYVIDTSLVKLADMFGEHEAKLSWRAGRDAIALIEWVIKEEGIECEFMKLPVHIYARNEDEYHALVDEHRLARKFGFDIQVRKEADLGFKHLGVLQIENQAKYHPVKFFYGLVSACEKIGVKFYEDTEALEIMGNSPVKVVTTGGQVAEGDDVIVATYDPFNNPKPIHFKKGMYTSYVYEFRVKTGELIEGLFMDIENPYHYVRVDKIEEGDRLIVGGEDHRNELGLTPEKSFKALYEYIEKLYPDKNLETIRRWKGKILEPSDGLPLIGETSPGQYVAAAFSGNGMTYAPISAMVIRDAILEAPNPYAKLYDPTRRLRLKAVLAKAKDYTGEFFGGAAKNLFRNI